MIRCAAVVVVAACLLAGAASAQKAKDTVRLAFVDPISTVLDYDDPKSETRLTSAMVFDNLVCFDPATRSFKPLLAASWRQVDDRTIEFKLRDDILFHDGTKLTAEDVAYTLGWIIAPNNNLRFLAEDFGWLDHVEKIDATTVRLVAKQPTPTALAHLSVSAPILPAKLHGPLADKRDFGHLAPVGSGPYKVVSLDAGRGIEFVKNDAYRHGGDCKHAPEIGHIRVLPIPDEQTQMAELATGGLDLLKVFSKDQADMLGANPAFAVTASQGLTWQYMTIDSINRSGNAALSNLKVRQALVRAIDRKLVAHEVLAGGDVVQVLDGLCVPIQIACEFSSKPPSYDPAAARALLTEAGYPDGIDLEITATPGSQGLGEALAGELRKIGVRARVDKVTFGTYRQKEVAGKLQILAGSWSAAGLPDVSATVDKFFDGGPRDYSRDPIIGKLAKDGLATLDETKRRAIYRQLFDRVNEQSYVATIANRPDAFVHTKDLRIGLGVINPYGAALTEMYWK
jgi:peptide/nickel transport system substrate-binding protein